MSSSNDPAALFAVGQAVKLAERVQVHGKCFGDVTQPLTLCHEDDNMLTVDSRELARPRGHSLSPADVPSDAMHWEYRLALTLPDTYILYKANKLIEGAKGRVRHTHVTKTQGTTVIEDDLIPDRSIVFLLRPFKYKAGSNTITLEVGTAIQIAGDATTMSGGLPGVVRPENAYYLIKTVTPEEHHYVWKSEYWVDEARLTAA